MSVTKPKLSLEKVLHLLRKPDARIVRLHSKNGGAGFTSGRRRSSQMKSRNCCWGAMTYSPTATACFPTTLRAGAWATGVTGPNACEGGRVSDEWPFGSLPRGRYGGNLADPPWASSLFREGQGPLSRPALRHHGRGDRAVAGWRDCRMRRILLLWITGPCLVLGMHLPVMRAWGFSPSYRFVWIKPNRRRRGVD